MATGDSPAVQRMQEEAMRRARDLHRRTAFPNPEEEEREIIEEEAQFPEESPEQSIAMPQPVAAPPAPVSMLDSLLKDKDQTLIIALLALLQDTGNAELMFALFFLLM